MITLAAWMFMVWAAEPFTMKAPSKPLCERARALPFRDPVSQVPYPVSRCWLADKPKPKTIVKPSAMVP